MAWSCGASPKTTSSCPAGGGGEGRSLGSPCLWFGTKSDPEQEESIPVLYANSEGGKLDPHRPRTLMRLISCAESLPLSGC